MTALPLKPHTEAEEATLKRIEAADPAPESHEVVERVAKALAYEDRIAPHWDELREKHQRYYRRQAVAAVEAMRGPSAAEEALARVEALAGELAELGDLNRERADEHRAALAPQAGDGAR